MISMSPKRVSEAAPVQVYLDRSSRDRLDRLAERLELTRSDVLRRGLVALEREASDPSLHPVLKLAASGVTAGAAPAYDVAREHDRFLASVVEGSAQTPSPRRSPRSRG
jgi:predicted transcriptional regulator